MPGPPPKNPRTRQRRNHVATHAVLWSARAPAKRKVPQLPDRLCGCGGPPRPTRKPKRGRPRKPCDSCNDSGILAWHPMTLAWWRDTWRSPMAEEFLEADKHRLFILARLVDLYWSSPLPDSKLAGEIRLQGMCFGLTPIDRRRLQWEMGDEDDKPQAPAHLSDVAYDDGPDPRGLLRAVK